MYLLVCYVGIKIFFITQIWNVKYIYRCVFGGLLRRYKNILYYPDMERKIYLSMCIWWFVNVGIKILFITRIWNVQTSVDLKSRSCEEQWFIA